MKDMWLGWGFNLTLNSLGSSLIIFLLFLFFRFLVKNDSLGNFDFIRQRHLDYPSNFEGLAKNDNAIG